MYCSLIRYLEKHHSKLLNIIHDACLEDQLKNAKGITFIIPSDKVVTKLSKLSTNPAEARDILGRYILFKVFSEANQFILRQDQHKIFNKNSEVMFVEKINDTKIKINKTCEAEKVDVDVYRAAIWEIKNGELDKSGEKIERKKHAEGSFEPSPRESAKTIWHQCVNSVNAALSSKTMTKENPIVSIILSISEKHEVTDFVCESPVVTLYSILKPNGQSTSTINFSDIEIKKHDPDKWHEFLLGEKKKYTFDLAKAFAERNKFKKEILNATKIEDKFKKLIESYEKIAPKILISDMTPTEKLWQDFVMFFAASVSSHVVAGEVDVEVFSRVQQVFGLMPGFDVLGELREQIVFTNTDVAILAKQSLFNAFVKSDAFLYTLRNIGMNDNQFEENLLKYGMGFEI